MHIQKPKHTKPIKRRRKNLQSDPWHRVVRALNDPRWEYRTLKGIASQSGLPQARVQELLKSNQGQVRKSVISSKAGEDLYTLRSKKGVLADYWNAFRRLSNEKYRSEK